MYPFGDFDSLYLGLLLWMEASVGMKFEHIWLDFQRNKPLVYAIGISNKKLNCGETFLDVCHSTATIQSETKLPTRGS